MPRADQPYSRESLRRRWESDPGFDEEELDFEELKRRFKWRVGDDELN